MFFIVEYIKEKEFAIEFNLGKLFFYSNIPADNKIYVSDIGTIIGDDGSRNINVINIEKKVWRI